MSILRNSRGQSLIEYVILVALVGVATIGLVMSLQKTVKVNMANIVHSLQSDSKRTETHEAVTADDVRKADFTNFMKGAANQAH